MYLSLDLFLSVLNRLATDYPLNRDPMTSDSLHIPNMLRTASLDIFLTRFYRNTKNIQKLFFYTNIIVIINKYKISLSIYHYNFNYGLGLVASKFIRVRFLIGYKIDIFTEKSLFCIYFFL